MPRTNSRRISRVRAASLALLVALASALPETLPAGGAALVAADGSPAAAPAALTGAGEGLSSLAPLVLNHSLDGVLSALAQLKSAALGAEASFSAALAAVAPRYRAAATNLVHYLALRRHDVRPLQNALHDLGLSSFGAAEAHVLPSLDAVLALAAAAVGPARAAAALGGAAPPAPPPPGAFAVARAALAAAADDALGPSPPRHKTRVMVTMPFEAADDPGVAAALVAGGMTLARLNCAHDGPAAWARMAANIRAADADAAAEAARRGAPAPPRTRLSFDLAGPKLRTGALAPGPAVLSWHPKRDAHGARVGVVRILLLPPGAPAGPLRCGGGGGGEPGAGASAALCAEPLVRLPLGEGGDALVRAAAPGDVVRLVDGRNRTSRLAVLARLEDASGLVVGAAETAYAEPGCALALEPAGGGAGPRHGGGAAPLRALVGPLPPAPAPLVLAPGDTVRFVEGDAPCRGPTSADPAFLVSIAGVPSLFARVRVGHRVLMDDGKFTGVVDGVAPDHASFTAVLSVVLGGSAKLGPEKGLNFPDTRLHLPALDADDVTALDAALGLRPDLIALSFVQVPGDVQELQARLAAAGADRVGVVLKIETAEGFANLPALLLQGLTRDAPFAIMIARGDLGVEVGFARMAEVQEELLWFAEAAAVPVIWATQVLDSLAKTGVPTRGDVTDAAAAERAEAVMLNKGRFMPEVLRFLDDVLSRAAAHEDKRRHMLRPLAVAERAFLVAAGGGADGGGEAGEGEGEGPTARPTVRPAAD